MKIFYITLLSITFIKIIFAFFIPDIQTWEDYVIAENILNSGDFYYLNDGAVNHSFQFPIYPILLSVALAIYHAPLAGVILNILLSALSCLVFKKNLNTLQKKQWINLNSNAILVLSLIPLLHPIFLYYELKNVHPFMHDFLMLNIGIAAFLYLMDEKSNRPIEGGILIGLAVLGRGTFIVFPFILLCILLYNKAYKRSALTIVGMALILSPWLIHNYISDDIIGLTSTNGKILWKGSLYHSEGGNYLLNGENYYSALSPADLNTLGQSSAKEQNEFFMNKYQKLLNDDPIHVISLFIVKLKNFWFLSEHTGNHYSDTANSIWFAYRIFNFVFVTLLLIALVKMQQQWFLLLPFVAISLMQCWFYFESRHRFLIEPCLIVILTHLLVTSYKSLKSG